MTKIEWTEKTWNPITGCTKVSTGCRNCYAESIAKRFWEDRKFTDVKFYYNRVNLPIRWRKSSFIFVNSMSDLFHKKVRFEEQCLILDVMRIANQHIYQVLTKRPEDAIGVLTKYFKTSIKFRLKQGYNIQEAIKLSKLPPHIWFGVSIENKTTLNRLDLLKKFPCKIKFISFEPLLEDIGEVDLSKINWVIVGGESGAKRRPFNPDWARNILKQCKEQNVAFFMKQVDKVQPIPGDLMVREYPKITKEK